jgi:hypothetical protein
MNWLERARREIPNTPYTGTAKTDVTNVSAVMAVPHRGISENSMPDPSTATRPFNQEDMDTIKGGGVVQVWSDLFSEWLLWARGDQERQALKAQGVKLTIYTLGELVLCAKVTTKEIETMHKLKRVFSSTIKERTP